LAEDRVYVVVEGTRKLIFEGYAGISPSMRLIAKGALLIEYCGGSIRTVNSFLTKDSQAGTVTAVRVQPVVLSRSTFEGVRTCDGT
jgi:hypothetical protein